MMQEKNTEVVSQTAEISSSSLTEDYIQAAVTTFMASSRVPGVCYASSLMAMGEFDHRGGDLKLDQFDDVKMIIPPNALVGMQLVYFALELDHRSDFTTTMSPIFICGPPGLNFKEGHPVLLTFPHAAVDVAVRALSKDDGSTTWNGDGSSVRSLTGNVVTLEIKHFTREKLSICDKNLKPVRNGERIRDEPGKRLSVAAFSSRSAICLYLVTSTYPVNIQEQAFEHCERMRGFVRCGQWEQVIFRPHRGELVVKAKRNNKDYETRRIPAERVIQSLTEQIDYNSLPQHSCLALHVQQKEANSECDLHLLAQLRPMMALTTIKQDTEATFNYIQFRPQTCNSTSNNPLGAGCLDKEVTTYGVQESGICDHYGGIHLPTCPLVGQPLEAIDLPSPDSSMGISGDLAQSLHSEDSVHSEVSVQPFPLGERSHDSFNVQTIPSLIGPSL